MYAIVTTNPKDLNIVYLGNIENGTLIFRKNPIDIFLCSSYAVANVVLEQVQQQFNGFDFTLLKIQNN